jgi:multidrug efflux system membrane fusion protein
MGPHETLEYSESGERPAGEPQLARPRGRSYWWLWMALVLAVGYGAWRFHQSRASVQPQDPPSAGRGRAGSFSIPVVIAMAERADLPVYLNGLGSVAAFNTVTVRSRVDGQIIQVPFREGQFVHQGDLLVEIDPRPFQVQLDQAQGQLARDAAQLQNAKANYNRAVALFKEGVIPKEQLDSQQAQVGQFEGAIRADQAVMDTAKLQLTFSRITAPISGRVGLRLQDAGNIVRANDANGLLVITQLQPIAVLFSLPQDQLPEVYKKLRAGTPLPVEAYDRDDRTKLETGKLLTIDNQIDSTTGTYKLKAVFANSDNALFPNQFVNVHLLLDTRRGLSVVPAAAIQRGPQGSFVFVVTNGATAKMRPVTVAMMARNMAGISAGLEAGDAVVVDGQDKLQDGTKVEARTATGGATGSPAGGGARSGGRGQ